jgi:hypothetical protein
MSPFIAVHVVRDVGGSFKITNSAVATSLCVSRGMRLATRDQLKAAWKDGLDDCTCGWLADGSVGYPIQVPRDGCGTGVPGIRTCSSTPSGAGWDVYCTNSPRKCTLFPTLLWNYDTCTTLTKYDFAIKAIPVGLTSVTQVMRLGVPHAVLLVMAT